MNYEEKYAHYVMVMVNYGHLWCKIENKTECAVVYGYLVIVSWRHPKC